MRLRTVLVCALLVVSCSDTSHANNFTWTFQKTGFGAGRIGEWPDTGLSMRDGLTWPVIFAADAFGSSNSIQAYSQFPVTNPNTGKSWHEVASFGVPSNPLDFANYRLRAASTFGGGIGFVVQSEDSADTCCSNPSSLDFGAVGSSQSGFNGVQTNVSALDFDEAGNPILANNSTLPMQPFGGAIYPVAIATSANGDLGAISQTNTDGYVTFWQNSPLLGGWQSTPDPNDGSSQNPFREMETRSLDLVFDSGGRPHFAGVEDNGPGLKAFSWNIISAQWDVQVLDTGISQGIDGVTLASNSDGMVGAAWVNNHELKYAFLDSTAITPSWTVTTVASTVNDTDDQQTKQLFEAQSVGLEFDSNGLPVISFVVEDFSANNGNSSQIWLAYDPPIAVPEPVTMFLLLSALTVMASLPLRRYQPAGRGDVDAI